MTLSRKRSSVFVKFQISEPYNSIGRQRVLYSFREVRGCKHPKREPTEFRAKNALLQTEAFSLVQAAVEAATVQRIPR